MRDRKGSKKKAIGYEAIRENENLLLPYLIAYSLIAYSLVLACR